ncbi:hypothetical protein CANARDRAFT_177996 [[Candida] arabinofermentans NRRL YB-2248]|uniref:Uncharacterized protein n=1 Tax=[Candida] arabinofermentans NRRL YB-2248 TaxID=983967 RepID=A0A1E4SUH5_9ASCO|nr:hypothetical protein CANARDRAFT_177996 [[Candida] arabinofermentans NRRL YB-2248]
MRTIYKISDLELRNELRTFTKQEFRSCQNVQDYSLKKSLVTNASRQFKILSSNLGLSLPGMKL